MWIILFSVQNSGLWSSNWEWDDYFKEGEKNKLLSGQTLSKAVCACKGTM